MADKPQRQYEIEGDGAPESVAKAAFSLAKDMIEERKDRKAAIGELTKGFPPLAKIVRYCEGLGWRGAISERWSQFSEVYADFMQLANLLYDKFGAEYDELFPATDFSREERIWLMMCDKMRPVVEDVLALLYEMLPEIKREIELKTESQERMTFFGVLRESPKKKPSLSVDEQRRIIDELGIRED